MDSKMNHNGMVKMNGTCVMGACFPGPATTTCCHVSAACYRELRGYQDVGSIDVKK